MAPLGGRLRQIGHRHIGGGAAIKREAIEQRPDALAKLFVVAIGDRGLDIAAPGDARRNGTVNGRRRSPTRPAASRYISSLACDEPSTPCRLDSATRDALLGSSGLGAAGTALVRRGSQAAIGVAGAASSPVSSRAILAMIALYFS